MAGWELPRKMAEYEFTQSREEGKAPAAVDALRPQFDSAGDDEQALAAVTQRLRDLPLRAGWPFDEPSDLPAIRALRAPGMRQAPLPYGKEVLFDRMYGAWLGRCAGCALGKPVEHYMDSKDGVSSKDRIKRYLLAAGKEEWPLNNYFPFRKNADGTDELIHPASCREKIAFMETDDDIRYTVLGQIILTEAGRGFDSWHVARAWMQHLPYRFVCTAETQAYRNLVMRYNFHAHRCEVGQIDWTWVATHDNPYREWIGAQIRADSWGYGAPGNPELAADFAWRDARISHVKNGIYGEMFCAAMIAAAFALDDPLAIVEAGLAEVPRTSRLYGEMHQTIDICRKHDFRAAQFEPVLDEIYALLGHYHPVHTNNNAALVVAALLLGRHDLEKVITIAVMGGWDSDCNGATAGSIAGAMLGGRRLPKKWIDPLHDRLNSAVIDYHPIAISECARRSVAIAL